MGARVAGILLGALFCALAHAIIFPLGPAAAQVPWLSLGPFETGRALVGGLAGALGVVLIITALMPKETRKRRATAPIAFAMDPAPAKSEPEPTLVFAPAPVLQQTLSPPVTVEDFQVVRARLRDLVRAEQWSEAGTLAQRLPRLAESDTEHALAAQDIGDFARGSGRLDDAADAYHDALTYARAAHKAAPGEPMTIDLLTAALTNVADVAADERRLDTAVDAYEEVLALRRAVVASGRADPPAQRALSLALERLADAREDRGHRTRALDLYRESFDIAGRLAALDPSRFGEDLAVTRRRLAELESRISAS